MVEYSLLTNDRLKNNNTIYEVQMQSDRLGNIYTPGATATSVFGEPISVPLTPIIQLDALYGLDPREFQTFSAFGGSFENTNTSWKCHTGTSAYGYGVIRSNRILRYRPGQGAMMRFTAGFNNPQAGVTLRAGFFAQEQALNVGYNGTEFGILRANGGKAHIHQFDITTGGTGTATITLNGVAVNVSIASADTQVVATTIAAASFPGWTVEQVGNCIKFLSQSLGVLAGAFTYSGTGAATASVLQTGVAQTENWTNQSEFNIDKLDGTGPSKMIIDTSKLNIFQCHFRWLGAGEIRWAIEDSITGDMVYFHHEHYSNRNTEPHLDNPSFRIGYIAANLSASTITDAHTFGSSMMAAQEGVEKDTAFTSATGSSKSSLNNILYHGLISVRNTIIYQSRINLRKVKLKHFSVACQSNDPVQIYLVLNATKSITHSWNQVAPFSCVIADVADGSYTIANEHIMSQFVVGAGDKLDLDLDKLEINIPPGGDVSVIAKSAQPIQSIYTAVTWVEV